MAVTYVPRPQFLPFHNREQRWSVVVTHRRAGKTVALANDLVVGALECPLYRPQLAYVGPTFTQAKRIAWQYLKDYSEPYWVKDPSESELKVTLKAQNGQGTIYCLGADKPDALRGMYLDAAAMDEYALFRPSVWTQIIRPALSDRNGWAVFTSTPRGRNLFHKVYREAQLHPDQYNLVMLSAARSGIIPAMELEDLRKHMDPEEFAQEYLCSFDSALKGAIYANEVNQMFSDGRAWNQEGPIDQALYDPTLPTHFVFDLGFTDAMVRIAWQNAPDGMINIVNVEATTGADIFYHISSLHAFANAVRGFGGGIGEVWLPHDARAKNLQTGKSVVEQFLENGITPRIVPNHHVRDGISAARRIFPAIRIDMTPADPSTPDIAVTDDLLEALKAYRREWDEDHMVFKEQPLHDWASDFADAFRYLAMVAEPGIKITHSSDRFRAEQPKIWLPNIGYNLETLHSDRLIVSAEAPRMS